MSDGPTPEQRYHAVRERMLEVSAKSGILSTKYEGLMKLYTAACQEDNAADMEMYRQLVLSTVEQVLDNTAVIHLLARNANDIKL